MDQSDLYFPDAGGTVDMTNPNDLLAPDNSQNLLAPDYLSGMRQGVAQGPTARPVYTGRGSYIQNGQDIHPSVKRKLAAGLLSIFSPEAARSTMLEPYQAELAKSAEVERQRQTKIAESKTLSDEVVGNELKKAQTVDALSQVNLRNQQAALAGRKVEPPDAKSLQVVASHINPSEDSHAYDWIGDISNPTVLAGLQTSLLKQIETPAEKNKLMDISWAAEPYAEEHHITSPEGIAALKKGFTAAPIEFAKSVLTSLDSANKTPKEDSLDKQEAALLTEKVNSPQTWTPTKENQLQAIRTSRKETQAPQVIAVQTVDADGKPVTKIVPKAVGEFANKPATADVPATVKSNVSVADRAIRQTKIVRDILQQHPELVGPFMGRISEFAQGAGSNPFAGNPKLERLGATLTGHLKYLFAQELKNAIGARPGEFLARELKEASPQRKQDINILLGALDSVDNNARVTLQSAAAQGYDPFKIGSGDGAEAATAPIIQQSPSTGQFRHSLDGGKTWLPGKP